MSFIGASFIFNGVNSDLYNLHISELDANAVNSMMSAYSLDIYEQKLYRRVSPFFYGSSPSQKLSFKFCAYSDTLMDADTWSIIAEWLFSPRSYSKFQIVQSDLQDIYANVIMNEPQVTKVGNLISGFECTVVAADPFFWFFPKTLTYNYSEDVIDTNTVFTNLSQDSGAYLYPVLSFTMNTVAGGSFKITNSDDSGRYFEFTNLSAGETLIVDCSNQTIFSSLGLKRLSHFNKKWMRFVPNLNHLHIQGNISQLNIVTQFISKKV